MVVSDSDGGLPAAWFEKTTKVCDVAGTYSFPAHLSQRDLLERIWPSTGVNHLSAAEYADIFRHLERLNPEHTSQLRFDRNSARELRDVVHGMVSGFNVEDINLFISR